MKSRGWHVQVYTNLAVISGIKDLVQSAPVPAVFDHFGGAQAAQGLEQPGFADLVELVRAGRAYVKISGAYRSSTQAPDYADVAPLAKALIAANADRVVWGSDWPHPAGAAPGRPFADVSSTVSDRRRAPPESTCRLGPRTGHPQENPRR